MCVGGKWARYAEPLSQAEYGCTDFADRLGVRTYVGYELTHRHTDGRNKNGRASDANACAGMVEEDAVQAAR